MGYKRLWMYDCQHKKHTTIIFDQMKMIKCKGKMTRNHLDWYYCLSKYVIVYVGISAKKNIGNINIPVPYYVFNI